MSSGVIDKIILGKISVKIAFPCSDGLDTSALDSVYTARLLCCLSHASLDTYATHRIIGFRFIKSQISMFYCRYWSIYKHWPQENMSKFQCATKICDFNRMFLLLLPLKPWDLRLPSKIANISEQIFMKMSKLMMYLLFGFWLKYHFLYMNGKKILLRKKASFRFLKYDLCQKILHEIYEEVGEKDAFLAKMRFFPNIFAVEKLIKNLKDAFLDRYQYYIWQKNGDDCINEEKLDTFNVGNMTFTHKKPYYTIDPIGISVLKYPREHRRG